MSRVIEAALSSLQSVLTWTPYSSGHTYPASPIQIKLPDLLTALPDAARDFRINQFCKETSEASDEWALKTIGQTPSRIQIPCHRHNPDSGVTEPLAQSDSLGGEQDDPETLDIKTGLLASMCFPMADRAQLRLCADFFAWIWLLDHHLAIGTLPSAMDCISESILLIENEPGCTEIYEQGFARGLQSILTRLERSPEAKYTYDRFHTAVLAYLRLLFLQLSESRNSSTPSQSMKSSLTRQAELGWHASLFILIEYAHGLESISSALQTNTSLRSTRDTAAHVIISLLDIYACAGAFHRSGSSALPPHNCVTLLTREQTLSFPQAIERAGMYCEERLKEFSALETQFFLRESSKHERENSMSDVDIYVRGLGDCIRGVLYWAFESERYFGRDGTYVRMTLTVQPVGDRSERIDGQPVEQ